MVSAGRGGRRSAVRQQLLPRMLGAARAPAAGREAARARAGRKRCRRHGRRARRRKRLLWREPCVATPRTPPPTPPGAARTRVSARTRGGRGTHAPTAPLPPRRGGGLTNHRGSSPVIDGGHQLAGQWRRRLCEAGRDYLPEVCRGGRAVPGEPRGRGRQGGAGWPGGG